MADQEDIDLILMDAEDRMDKSVEVFKRESDALRTGRANPGLVEGLKIELYGTTMPLNQLATISAPDPRLLVVQPFDRSAVGAIEKEILKSDLGLTPQTDGVVIRLPIPTMTQERRQEMGSGARDVARIVPEVREKLQVELREPGDPEEDRYRLLQAVSDFLGNAASVQPLMLVLEDLHDADRGTLELLTHGARNLSGARLLIVGTYRDVEVDRAHPLSGALAELRRVSTFDRVHLRGLTPDEVQRGTFTITNPGVFGSYIGTPIINQPQVAILGVGAIEKRPKILTLDDGQDVIAIRTMSMFSISYDHRIVDGADADRFMADLKRDLEAFPEGAL